MIKVNPLLEKKIFGISVNEIITLCSGAICANLSDNCFKIENFFLNVVVFIAAWILGSVIWIFVISMIKTYITKED